LLLRPLKIGSLVLSDNLLLAPLAGVTNHAFRLICRFEGACLAYTEMVSVNGLVRDGKKTFALLSSSDADCPLGVQLFGDQPELLAKAAAMVENQVELIDINMGCPVRKVVGTGAGSALLKDTPRITAIIKAVRKATTLPLTIKIRSGWEQQDETWQEVGKIAEAEGCDGITFHPRSRSQMFSGRADWSKIAALKQCIKIPVIGNGDLFSADDCRRMLEETGCDGVMIARGAMGNPWIFRQTKELLAGTEVSVITPSARAATARKHLHLFSEHAEEKTVLREMKKHLGWYIHGLNGAAALRKKAHAAGSLCEMYKLLDEISALEEG